MIYDATNVVPLARRMNQTEYESERERIRDVYGESRKESGVRWEQELARLFVRSGWTQQQLAEEEDKPQGFISRQLCFGRFLCHPGIMPSGHNVTERQFRGYWEQTDEYKGNEAARFDMVLKLIAEEPTLEQRRVVSARIKAEFGDGKWHPIDTIVAAFPDLPPEVVERPLRKADLRNARVEHKVLGLGAKRSRAYRIFLTDKTVPVNIVITKLRPIIDRIRRQGKADLATVSFTALLSAASDLDHLLEEWSE